MPTVAAPRRASVAAPSRAPRRAPARPRTRPQPGRRPGGQLIPLAVGTATAVRNLPDSGLVVRMTRGRIWIGVLGVLLAGIVALNVLTLSFAAEAGRIDKSTQALAEENSALATRDAQLSGAKRVRDAAAALGLATPAVEVAAVRARADDAAVAAQRLAAAEAGY